MAVAFTDLCLLASCFLDCWLMFLPDSALPSPCIHFLPRYILPCYRLKQLLLSINKSNVYSQHITCYPTANRQHTAVLFSLITFLPYHLGCTLSFSQVISLVQFVISDNVITCKRVSCVHLLPRLVLSL